MDVIVIGAGPAGLMAAIASARNSVETLLVDASSALGGGMGASNSNFINGTHNTINGECVIKGYAAEFIERLIKEGASPGYILLSSGAGLLPFDAELIKFVIDDVVREVGVKVLFNTIGIDAIVHEKVIKGAILYNKSGQLEVPAKVVIDASGDGDVAVAAGASFEMANVEELQMHTLMFKLSHVNLEKIIQYSEDNPGTVDFNPNNLGFFGFQGLVKKANDDAKKRGNKPIFYRPIVIALPTLVPGEYWMLMTDVPAVATDGEAISNLQFKSRDQVRRIIKGLKSYIPGFESAYLSCIAPQVGVRETRRIVCDKMLKRNHIIQGREFSDVVCRLSHHIDLHDNMKRGHLSIPLESSNGFYDVPYGCLLPKDIEGLLVAGKCISTDHEAWGAMRIQANCLMTGQVAGTAAAFAIKHRVMPRELNIEGLQEHLEKMGALDL
jgi:hypothetical protein